MSDLNEEKTNRREFLKLFGLSSASILASGILTNGLLANVPCNMIPVAVMIKPNVLRCGCNDKFSSTVIFPEGYDISEVDVSSVRCEDAYALDSILCHESRTIVFLYNSSHLMYSYVFLGHDVSGVGRTVLPYDLSASFTVTGHLKDGSIFNGSDTVMITEADQPFVYHLSRRRKSCNACRNHAMNRIYPSVQNADKDRAHTGCNCRIVAEQIGWQDYVKAFWHSSRGNGFVYDRRWGFPPPSPEGLRLESSLCLDERLRRG